MNKNTARILFLSHGGGPLVIGSGFSFHNVKPFFAPETSASRTKNEAFERWFPGQLPLHNQGCFKLGKNRNCPDQVHRQTHGDRR